VSFREFLLLWEVLEGAEMGKEDCFRCLLALILHFLHSVSSRDYVEI
jgi:hypothetical protein